ncbi:riboflavin synthase [Shewanella sp. OPT22]|nr:riboflavin synthase [Shewanella sp. OPT22]
MFTGIVQATCKVVSIEAKPGLKVLELDIESYLTQGLKIGASVAVNGVCLTVTKHENDSVFFDVMEETLALTNLNFLKVRDKVNIERSLTFSSEIGGHVLSGHIQTQAKIVKISNTDEHHNIELEVPSQWMKYIMYKGFIAINGCSLTIGKIKENKFLIHLIPETLRLTNLESYSVGDAFNIEIDSQTQAIVNTVERYLKQS